MNLTKAKLTIPEPELRSIVLSHCRKMGWNPETVSFRTYEIGHNGPSSCEATVTLVAPSPSHEPASPPADAP